MDYTRTAWTRHSPREVQVIAYEKGMIPYIPVGQE